VNDQRIKIRRKKQFLYRNFSKGNSVELIKSGLPYFAEVEKVIAEAQKYIHFQMYIFNEDETGRLVLSWLKKAVERGVKIYLLVDGYGSMNSSDQFINEIKEAGILYRQFAPMFSSKGLQLGLRLHHKIILADGNTAIIGGINVSNNYRGTETKRAWLDYAVKVRGPICSNILTVCKRHWNKLFVKERATERVFHPYLFEPGIKAKIVENNWLRRKIEISYSYREGIRRSKNEILIMASYFLPGRRIRNFLQEASLRGVDIKIVLSAESDARVMKRATNFLYRFILRNKIEIYEYQPTNVHAKVAVVDKGWASVGSYNLNHLSDYGSLELNINVKDKVFASIVRTEILDIIKNDCIQYTFDDYLHRKSNLSKLADWFAYQIIRLSMRLMFYLTKK
jgi:cardiolipin synthase A/B